MKTEWGVGGGGGWGRSHLLSLQQAPAHHLPASLSRPWGGCRAGRQGGTARTTPHRPGGQQPENSAPLSLAPSPPPTVESGPTSAEPPPAPFYLISPVRLPEPGSPHLGQAGCGAPSRLPRVAGLGAGRRGSRGGLCGAACSVTPPPADGCRLQQRWRRLGVRRGLGTVPTAPGLAPNARPPPPPPGLRAQPRSAAARLPAPSGRPAPASASSRPSPSPSPFLSLRLPGHLLPRLPER